MNEGLSFIIADDETMLHSVLRRGVQMSFPGYTIKAEIVENGAELYAKVASQYDAGQPYHGIVTDHNMPKKTGLQAIIELQERGIVIPTLIITGKGSEEIIARLPGLARTTLLVKPFPMEVFIETAKLVWPEYVRVPATTA